MYPPVVSQAVLDISYSPQMTWTNITTSDNIPLNAWYKKAEIGKPTFLMFHGNGGTIQHLAAQTETITSNGYGLLLAEYRYYAGNPGTPSEEGFYNDARAYYNWLLEQNVENIIIYGQSLGSGVAVQLATEVDCYAIVLEVPFSSALDVAQYKYPFLPFLNVLMLDQYRNDIKIHKIKTPLLIGLAGNDTEVPINFGKKLYTLANNPKTIKIYENAQHQNIYQYGFAADLIDFVDDLTNTEPDKND